MGSILGIFVVIAMVTIFPVVLFYPGPFLPAKNGDHGPRPAPRRA